ncbi:glycosyltransferase family 25 protein [Hoeflea sp. WL0058]|uniref:Glycosyltransferase family 25 protein n=1 Tax=Flavimaribacter sediminis TaxID=2865987 RepID=A0AAE3D281_9HYPH|nr:glycosyltransferase family 25 protein [Flavimaribacter sediminis]MBW8638288.1 glycosyltransferase family 25 protein [Flavimaribacter sediminis]
MRILVINPDRYTERLRWLESQFSRIGLDFERVSACDGSTLTEDEIQRIAQSCVSGLKRTPNEYACNISHKTCWRIVADGKDEHVCIFEDDVHLSRDAGKFLSSSSWIPGGADLIKLETFNKEAEFYHKQPVEAQDRTLYPLRGLHQGSAGYIISKTAAKRLLDETRNDYGGVSYLLFGPKPARSADLRVYQLYPALCIQDMRLSGHKNPQLSSSLGHKELANSVEGRQAMAEWTEKQAPGARSRIRRDIKERFKRLFDKPFRNEIVPFQE